jgi:hypothetical protein
MTSAAEIEQYQKENQILKEQIEKLTGKTTEQLYEERERRVRDVIYLRKPDRVPFNSHVDIQAYTGTPNSAAYYDPIAFKRAVRKITLDIEPDMCNAGLPTSGAALTALDVKNRLWPGGPLPPDYEYQFVEGEYMKEDEYDMFLTDPSGFVVRRFLPRMYGALLPLEKLPRLDTLFQGFEGLTPLFASPEFLEMARRVAEAGRQIKEFRQTIGNTYEELAQLGFPAWAPVITGGVGGAPFDTVSSFLRGMKGSMVDMYRQPEKLIKACNMIVERRISGGIPAASLTIRGNPKMIGMPLWRGDKAFMSEAQFNRFYWPGLKRALQATIDLGYVPVPFFEAEFGDRLARLLELPKGKIIASVEYMDSAKAKEILGGHTCLLVRGPLSSKLWSLQEVEKYTKELIDRCGKGGGLMLDIRLPDKAKAADIQAMMKSINEYSRY